MPSNNIVHYLKVEGSYEEMGRQHGTAFSPLIKSLYFERLNILLESNSSVSIDMIKVLAENLWLAVVDFDSRIAAEITAIAKACQLDTWQLIVAGAYSDIIDLLVPTSQNMYHECSIIINPFQKIIAGTWDSHSSAINSLILLERHPKDAPATLALTTAGWPCQQGVNSEGVGFAITNLTPRKINKSALVYIAANAAIGFEASVDNLISRFSETNFCSGHSYIMMDEKKSVIVETTAERIRVININDLSVKTNHYQMDDDSIDNNGNYLFIAGSRKRQSDFLKVASLASDFENFSRCLLETPSVNRIDKNLPAITCAHFFISIREKTIWFSKGPATHDQHPKIKYKYKL